VNGSLASTVATSNYGNGLRLLGSSLSVNSKEGHGGYFDELLLNTQGLGNDPYQFRRSASRRTRCIDMT
jgi:hypothetical protein